VTDEGPGLLIVNVALLALVIAGAWFTDNVKDCVAAAPTPLSAVDRDRVGSARPQGRRARERRGAVVVVRERHPEGSVPVLA
jgi:hypothetical protein